MKINDKNGKLNAMNSDVRELTPEELEQVEGGGMKEILAAMTLAAMAATSPVATGLAEELSPAANAIVEHMDVAEEAAAAEVVELAAEDEAVEVIAEEDVAEAEVAEEVGEAEAAIATEETEIVVTGEEEEQPSETEATEEAADPDMDLMAAFDEADKPEVPEETEAAETDKAAMMEQLIGEAMDERRTEGIYAALDNTFATLAENAMAFSNPETGVIEVSGEEIVSMTASAAQARFGTPDDLLNGAIGVAALRAESNGGYVSALGGDAKLMAMAAEEGDAETGIGMVKDLAKSYLELGIEALGEAHPAFKALSPLMKGLLGVAFDENKPDPMKDMQKKLDEIDHKLDEIEESVKTHTDNVVSLSNRGLAFDSISANTMTLRTRMKNIWDPDSGYTYAQKIQQTADLYRSDYVKDLETALNGGTKAFDGTLKDLLQGRSVFDAAYRTACESVMFSSEAIDSTAPYLYRVLADYIAGYKLLGEVYDCYEAVYGSNKLLASRDEMYARLGGIDRRGNRIGKSVMDLYIEHFNRDRFIFVNKSNNTNIKLNPYILTVENFAKACSYDNSHYITTPDYVKKNPLSDKQVKSLAEYCQAKGKSVFQYLLNEMGFTPVFLEDGKFKRYEELNPIRKFDHGISKVFRNDHWATNGKSLNRTYLATGAQTLTTDSKSNSYGMGVSETNYRYYAQGIQATCKCTGKDERVEIMHTKNNVKVLEKVNKWTDDNFEYIFLFFQAR